MDNIKNNPYLEAILEDVLSSDLERDIAITRLRRISTEISKVGGVRE